MVAKGLPGPFERVDPYAVDRGELAKVDPTFPIYNEEMQAHFMDIVEALDDPHLRQLIEDGQITMAMIRPQANLSLLEKPDTESAFIIESHIENLGLMAKFAVVFDDQFVEEFYQGAPRRVMRSKPPKKDTEHETLWEEFRASMTVGPTTILILHDPGGEATSKWRGQIGHRDVEGRRDPSSLRGRFARDNYNNLLHGSDSIKSVKREIGLIKQYLQKLAEDEAEQPSRYRPAS